MTMYLRQVRSLCLTLAVMYALPASVVSAGIQTFTKSETASGKLSGRMPLRFSSDDVPCGSAPNNGIA